jgi:F-type H+-transporting ATPase subunit a
MLQRLEKLLSQPRGPLLLGLLGFGSFAFGIAFTVLELFIAALQAYVFAVLTAIYIQLAVAEEH